jgi:hypothetical protein
MRPILTTLTVVIALLSAASQAMAARPAAAAPTPADYTVFVDAPTGFVFVKLPQGWKFAGKADAAPAAALPAHVTTRLLPVTADDARQTGTNLLAANSAR